MGAFTDFALTNGAVNTTTNVLPGGSYNVTAHYPGDGNFAASDSAPVAVTVIPEGSKTAVSFISQNAQGNPLPFNSGPYGSAVYLRADVSGNSGDGVPTGTVTFLDGGKSISGISALALNSQGNVLPTNPTSTFTAGTHSITAGYSGDSSFNASTSPAGSFSITQAVTTAAPPNVGNGTSILGSSALVSGMVNAQSCGNLPTGTITFFDGSTQLGTAQAVQSGTTASCAVQATASPCYQRVNARKQFDYLQVQRRHQLCTYEFPAAAAQLDAQIGTGLNTHFERNDNPTGPVHHIHRQGHARSIRTGHDRHRIVPREFQFARECVVDEGASAGYYHELDSRQRSDCRELFGRYELLVCDIYDQPASYPRPGLQRLLRTRHGKCQLSRLFRCHDAYGERVERI